MASKGKKFSPGEKEESKAATGLGLQQQQQQRLYGRFIPNCPRRPARHSPAATTTTATTAKPDEEEEEKPPLPKRESLKKEHELVLGGSVQNVSLLWSTGGACAGVDGVTSDAGGNKDNDFEDDGYCGLRIEATTCEDVVSRTWERKKPCRISKEERCPLNLRGGSLGDIRIGTRDLHGQTSVDNQQHCLPHADTNSNNNDNVSSTCYDDENEEQLRQLQPTATELATICQSIQESSSSVPRAYKQRSSVMLEEGCIIVVPELNTPVVSSSTKGQHSPSMGFAEEAIQRDRGEANMENVENANDMYGTHLKEISSPKSQAFPESMGIDKEQRNDHSFTDSSFQCSEGVPRSPLQDTTNKPYEQRSGYSQSCPPSFIQSRKNRPFDDLPYDLDTDSSKRKLSSTQSRKTDKFSVDDHPQSGAAGFQQSVVSPVQSRKNKTAGSDPLPRGGITLLHKCSACQSPSSKLTLTQCFHLACPKCVLPASEPGWILCGACKAQQVAPHEDGMTSLADMFPDFLMTAGDSVVSTSTETISSDCTTPDDVAEHRAVSEASGDKEACAGDGVVKTADKHEENTTGLAAATVTNSAATPIISRSKDTGSSSEQEGWETDQNRSERKHQNTAMTTLPDSGDAGGQDADSIICGENTDSESTSTIIASWSNDHSTSAVPITDVAGGSTRSDSADNSAKRAEVKHPQHHFQQQPQIKQRRCGACQAESMAEGEDTLPFKHMCVTCGGVLLCEGCRTAHATLPVTRSHELVPVTTPGELTRLMSPLHLMTRRQPVCPQHGQEIVLQCRTCAVFLCHRCLSPEHCSGRHEVRDLGNLHHQNRKKFSGLQRSVKQHLLAARATRREVSEQLASVEGQCQRVVEQVRAAAGRTVARVEARAEELCKEVDRRCGTRRQTLNDTQENVARVLDDGETILEALGAVRESTPHLTCLVLQNICQAHFDRLRRQAPLRMDEPEDVVLCEDSVLEADLARNTCLGNVRTLVSGLASTSLRVLSIIQTGGEVSAVAVTPYNEIVTVSTSAGTCRLWNQDGAMLNDVTCYVTRPCDVQVTPGGGLVVVLGSTPVNVRKKGTSSSSLSSRGSGRNAEREDSSTASAGPVCLTLLSPAGSLLTRLSLPSPSSNVQFTHIHCPSDDRVLVSDEAARTVTLFAVEKGENEEEIGKVKNSRLGSSRQFLRPIRRFCCSDQHLLQSPRHVTINLTGDWLINDGGCFLRAITLDEGQVTTVLSEDEPDAVLQPPTPRRLSRCYGEGASGCDRDAKNKSKRRRRLLTSVCCDSRGRIMAADAGKNGIYISTARPPERGGERRFMSLQELTTSSGSYVSAVAVDRQDNIVVGLSDGKVCVLEMESGNVGE